MPERIYDGATVCLNRQLDMIRHLLRNNKKGLIFNEIHFYMSVRHGLTVGWVEKYLKQWVKFGIVFNKGNRFHVDEDKLKLVWEARDKGFDVYGPLE